MGEVEKLVSICQHLFNFAVTVIDNITDSFADPHVHNEINAKAGCTENVSRDEGRC